MKRLTDYLKTKSSEHSGPVHAQELPDRLGVKLKPAVNAQKDKRRAQIAFDAKLHGRVESGGSGKNVLLPEEDATDYTKTQALLRILGETSNDLAKTTGIDPYNSGTK